jgi:hypothetical protein
MLTRDELNVVSLTGDLRQGGWELRGRVDSDTDAVRQGLNIKGRGKSLSSIVDPLFRQYFTGHIVAQPDFSFSRYASGANWEAATVHKFLAGLDIQDISFAVVASPANAHEATSWRFSTIIKHILEKHCNVIYDADGSNGSPDGVVTGMDLDLTDSTLFDTVGDRFIVGHSENIWSTLQKIGGGEEGGGEFYRIWCDRRNVIHYQPAPPFISPKPTAKGTLTKEHIRGNVQVRFNNTGPGQRIGQVQMVAGINPTTIFESKFPGSPAGGRVLKKTSGVWAGSQGRADLLAERLWRWVSRPYTINLEVDPGLVAFGDDGLGLDIGDRVLLTYAGPVEDAATGAGVHLDLEAQSMFVYNVSVNFDLARRSATANLTLEYDSNPE